MTHYYRILAGKGSKYTAECFAGGFIGVDFDFGMDLTHHLPDNWRDFNEEFIPIYLANNPGKTKVAAGLACGMTHTVAKGIQIGDVICRDVEQVQGAVNLGRAVAAAFQVGAEQLLLDVAIGPVRPVAEVAVAQLIAEKVDHPPLGGGFGGIEVTHAIVFPA